MGIGNEESGFSRLAKRTASAILEHGFKVWKDGRPRWYLLSLICVAQFVHDDAHATHEICIEALNTSFSPQVPCHRVKRFSSADLRVHLAEKLFRPLGDGSCCHPCRFCKILTTSPFLYFLAKSRAVLLYINSLMSTKAPAPSRAFAASTRWKQTKKSFFSRCISKNSHLCFRYVVSRNCWVAVSVSHREQVLRCISKNRTCKQEPR